MVIPLQVSINVDGRSTCTYQVQYNRDFTHYQVSIIMAYAKTNTQIALLISALVFAMYIVFLFVWFEALHTSQQF